jgi:hypothetical protein
MQNQPTCFQIKSIWKIQILEEELMETGDREKYLLGLQPGGSKNVSGQVKKKMSQRL